MGEGGAGEGGGIVSRTHIKRNTNREYLSDIKYMNYYLPHSSLAHKLAEIFVLFEDKYIFSCKGNT